MQSGEVPAHGLLHPNGLPAGRAVGGTPPVNTAAVADAIHRSGEAVLAKEREVHRIGDEIKTLDAKFGSEAEAFLERTIRPEHLTRGAVLDASSPGRSPTPARHALCAGDGHGRNNSNYG